MNSRADGFDQDADVVLEAYDNERIVWLTSPHNPTGSTMPLEEIERLADETDDETLVVVDEAYGEFADRDSAPSPCSRAATGSTPATMSPSCGRSQRPTGWPGSDSATPSSPTSGPTPTPA